MRFPPALLAFALSALLVAGLGGCGSGSTDATLPPGNGDAGAVQLPGGNDNFPPTGNQYVDARRCPACHQTTNPTVDGFMSGTVAPIPGSFGAGVKLYGPNLTPDPMTGIGNWDDAQIINAIMNGIDAQSERLCPQMGHFPDMQQAELTSILGYLHSLKAVVHQSMTSSCPPLKP